jgi:hypothetical protein
MKIVVCVCVCVSRHSIDTASAAAYGNNIKLLIKIIIIWHRQGGLYWRTWQKAKP